MRFTAFFLLVCSLQLSASVSSQSLTLNGRMSMNKVFEEVRKQTGYLVFYDLDVINAARPVSLNVKDMPLVPFLQEVLSERDLTFTIRDKNIIIRTLDKPAGAPVPATETAPPSVIAGVVLLADGTPMPGANILIKGGKSRAITDENGRFQIQAKPGDILVVTFVGFIPQEIRATETMRITLQQSVSPLDEKIVQAYGLTSQRLSTSNIFKVSGKDVNKSPVTNVLAALAGRVPGVDIVQSTGNPGSAFNVIIRGRTQLDKFNSASNEPLFILDGVPLAAGNANINRIQSAISASSTSGLSPINSINMADIESIEVLKDADATAIYGSRGANGVIMITTRRAKTGDTRYSFNVYNGVSKAKLPKLLNTKDYVAMRNEAFANDNRAKTISNAYDLLVFDTTFDANLPKEFIGGSASKQNFHGTFEAFRKAVKRNNIDSVKQYIHFPLQTALQWTNDDVGSGPVDKAAGLVTYSEFKEYYADIFHADVRRLLPGTVESELQEIDDQTNEDYYKTLQQVTDKGSKLYEAYLQYPERNGRSESFFAFVFGRINGQYKVVAYYAKWPVKG